MIEAGCGGLYEAQFGLEVIVPMVRYTVCEGAVAKDSMFGATVPRLTNSRRSGNGIQPYEKLRLT